MRRFIRQIFWWLIAVLVFAVSIWIMMPVYQLGFEEFQGDNTVNAVTQWVKICGLVFLFGVIWSIKTNQPQQQGDSSANKSIGLWKFVLFSTSMILISIAIFNILVDPRDLYGQNFVMARVNPSRTMKLKYYSELSETPDMIIVGTSAAFMIAPTYIQDTLGLDAFNWALDGGQTAEIQILLRYLSKQHTYEYPSIILMQVSERNSSQDYKRLPLELLPYTKFWPFLHEGSLRLAKTLELSQFSESLYTLRHTLSPNPTYFSGYYFLRDGFGDQIRKNFSEALVVRQAEKVPDCNSVEEIFGKDIENIISFSEKQNSSIIFYISPYLPSFYDEYVKDNPDYQRCHQMVTAYFTELAMENDDVFFKDYSLLESLNGLDGEEGFYDAAHLTPRNSEILIDALSDTILQAYEVAEGKRNAGGGGSE